MATKAPIEWPSRSIRRAVLGKDAMMPRPAPRRVAGRHRGRYLMRRVSLVLFVFVLGSLGAWGSHAGAQEATPAPFATPGPGEFAVAPGQIGRDLAAGQLDALPQTPAFIALSRITSAPGSVFTAA